VYCFDIVYHWQNLLLQGVPENKNTQIFAPYKFCSICHGIVLFAPRCMANIVVCKSAQNLCKVVKYCFISSQKCSHLLSDITCHASLTVTDQLLMKTLQIEKGWTVDRITVEFAAIRCIIFCTICMVRRSRTLTV